MRILAIRGSDLASLAGPFAVELDAPPLGGCGLFAITGNTGAGKSTVLDALCLALFDRMPRLPEGQGVEVGRREEQAALRLKSNDVRSILRRGAGEGHAEVDFRGNDGRAYRARWTLRRARGRADGRLQQQVMELTELAGGQALGRTKTEVLEQIHARLGLNFEQFRRSALLAQGDFAAFLKARSGERAALLERITGTEIYGELSKAAHGRAGEERRALELLQQRLGEHRPLEAEQRRLLEAECKVAKTLLEQQEKEQTRLATAHQWYRDLTRLEAEQAEARQALDSAERAWEEAAPRHRQWQRIRDIQPLRGPLQEWDRTATGLGQAGSSLAWARDQEQEKGSAVEGAAEMEEQARLGLQTAETRARETEPLLKQARMLDTRLDAARAQLKSLRSGRETADAKVQQAGQELESLDSQLTQLRAAAGEAEGWLAGHAHLAPLAEQWDGWRRELERYGQSHTELDAATRAAADACVNIKTLQLERAGRVEMLEQSRRVLQQSEQAVAALERQAERLDLQELASRRQSLQGRERRLDRLRSLCATMLELRVGLRELESALQECLGKEQAEASKAEGLKADLSCRSAALEEAQGALQGLLQATAADVEVLRGGLKESEPCPVCGSPEHPWAGSAHRVPDRLLQEQRGRAEALESEVGGLREARSRAESDAANARRRAGELESEREAARQRLDKTLEEWRYGEADPLRPDDPFEPGLLERIDAAQKENALELEGIQQQEKRARTLLTEQETARRGLEGVRKALTERERSLGTLDEQLREAERLRDQAQRESSVSQAELERLRALLAEPLAGIEEWRERLDADPGAFLGQCGKQAELWRETAEQRRRAEGQGVELEPRLAEARQRLEGARVELEERRRSVAEHERQLQQLGQERGGLLQGRPADAVEAELRKQLTAAEEALEAARRELSGRREALAGATQLRWQGERNLEQSRREAEQADGSLARLLGQHGIEPQALREALVHDHDWVEGERKALDELQGDLQQARALLDERSGRIRRHRETGVLLESAEQIEALLNEFRDTLERARDAWAVLKGRLDQDDRRRNTSSELQREEQKQLAVCHTWDSLRELIGSADGSKFRSFAQGLTLRLLLAHANVHLQDLARRYLLEPVPGVDLELQVVDREMGDEVRSVHSLSGGESFLVSLALALGLASLASERVQVESLFIDEGFGALDAEALDMAIASLDTLYSLGRQVGVISHVPTLVERIGVQVRVEARGGGRSQVRVVGL